jgi:hypothetical protein
MPWEGRVRRATRVKPGRDAQLIGGRRVWRFVSVLELRLQAACMPRMQRSEETQGLPPSRRAKMRNASGTAQASDFCGTTPVSSVGLPLSAPQSVNCTPSEFSVRQTTRHRALAERCPQPELVRNGTRSYSSKICAAIGHVAQDARPLQMPVGIVDRRRQVPLDPEVLAPVAPQSRVRGFGHVFRSVFGKRQETMKRRRCFRVATGPQVRLKRAGSRGWRRRRWCTARAPIGVQAAVCSVALGTTPSLGASPTRSRPAFLAS